MVKNRQKLLDTSKEFDICRYRNGIKLLRPGQSKQIINSACTFDTGYTVGSALQLSCNVYFLNRHSELQNLNEENAATLGASIEECIGKTAYFHGRIQDAARIINNDKQIIKTDKIKMLDEDVICDKKCCVHNKYVTALSVKSPWYNHNNEIIGVFGCSIVLGRHSISKALAQVSQLGLLGIIEASNSNNFLPGTQISDVYLSKRETEILRLLVRGQTAKRTAIILGISYRTVEKHLENIKDKMGVVSKAELIDKAFENYNA